MQSLHGGSLKITLTVPLKLPVSPKYVETEFHLFSTFLKFFIFFILFIEAEFFQIKY